MRKERGIFRKIHTKNSIERIEKKIDLLGVYCEYNAIDFLNARLSYSILLFVVIFLFLGHGHLIAPIVTLLYYTGIEYYLFDYQIKKRSKRLEEEAIFFFEVLALTLESGRNLNSALEITSNNIDSEISAEFKKSLSEIKMGKSFAESIGDMKHRIPSESINNVLLNMTQSSIFGSSILEPLNNQLDYLREKQILGIKAEISKLPTKISVISVIFFIPIMLLIILAPALLEFLAR